jgi:hypothetical protein
LRRAAKVDRNQSEIVAALRKRGAVCILTHQLKNAFDLIVCFNGKTHMVEIKDGELPPSARKLTEGELRCKSLVEGVGCAYNVINSVQEAIDLIES